MRPSLGPRNGRGKGHSSPSDHVYSLNSLLRTTRCEPHEGENRVWHVNDTFSLTQWLAHGRCSTNIQRTAGSPPQRSGLSTTANQFGASHICAVILHWLTINTLIRECEIRTPRHFSSSLVIRWLRKIPNKQSLESTRLAKTMWVFSTNARSLSDYWEVFGGVTKGWDRPGRPNACEGTPWWPSPGGASMAISRCRSVQPRSLWDTRRPPTFWLS